jgi:uncharacterized protein YjdB
MPLLWSDVCRRYNSLVPCLPALALAACGGGGDGGGTTDPTPVAQVAITSPTGAVSFATLGRQVTFTAEARDASGNPLAGRTISFSSSNTAAVSINSSTGVATAVGNGAAQITAASEGVTSAAVSVTVSQVTAQVNATPATKTFGAIGSTQQLTAQALDSASNPIPGKTAAWSSSNTAVVTVNATGLATSTGEGSASVVAAIDGKADTIAVTVAVVVASVAVSPGSFTFNSVGDNQAFTATAQDSNLNQIAGKTFTWASTNTGVVTVDAATGVATSVANGSAQVQATTDAITGSASVTVDILVASLTVDPDTIVYSRIGVQRALSVTALDGNGNPIANAGVAWASRNTNFVTVDAQGVATSVADGATYVVATATSNANAKDSVEATVSAVANAVSVNPGSVAFGALNSTQQLEGSVLDSGGTAIPGRGVTWAMISANGAASINSTGLVTALANGNDTATATAPGPAGTLADTVPISVAQVVRFIVVSSTSATPDTLFTTGRQRQFSAAASDSNNNAIAGAAFTWSSSATGVATVDPTGLVTAVADGTAQITASSGGANGSRPIVVRRYAEVITVDRSLDTIKTSGGTLTYNATVQDSAGTNLPTTWSSSNTGVATVSPTSGSSTTATAVANGTTTITASGGTRSVNATLVVNVPVSFSGQVQPIFTSNCALSGCHTGANPTGPGLNLSAGQAYSNLVNVPSTSFSGATRVIPNNANDSYLIRKLENRNIVGSQMPEGAPPLPASTIQIIKNWINEGALNN